VPWVAGLGNRGGKTVGVLVGRRTSEGVGVDKPRSQPATGVEIYAEFKGGRGMSRKTNTRYILLPDLLSSRIG
jgi:hypothetical protein